MGVPPRCASASSAALVLVSTGGAPKTRARSQSQRLVSAALGSANVTARTSVEANEAKRRMGMVRMGSRSGQGCPLALVLGRTGAAEGSRRMG